MGGARDPSDYVKIAVLTDPQVNLFPKPTLLLIKVF